MRDVTATLQRKREIDREKKRERERDKEHTDIQVCSLEIKDKY